MSARFNGCICQQYALLKLPCHLPYKDRKVLLQGFWWWVKSNYIIFLYNLYDTIGLISNLSISSSSHLHHHYQHPQQIQKEILRMYLLIVGVRMLLFPSIQLQKKSWHQLNPCHVQRYHSISNILYLIILPMILVE